MAEKEEPSEQPTPTEPVKIVRGEDCCLESGRSVITLKKPTAEAQQDSDGDDKGPGERIGRGVITLTKPGKRKVAKRKGTIAIVKGVKSRSVSIPIQDSAPQQSRKTTQLGLANCAYARRFCNKCDQSVCPFEEYYPTLKTHLLALIFFILGLPFLIFVPYCFMWFGKPVKRCPICWDFLESRSKLLKLTVQYRLTKSQEK